MTTRQRKHNKKHSNEIETTKQPENIKNDVHDPTNNDDNYLSSKFPWKKIIIRFIISILLIGSVYWTSIKDPYQIFASHKEKLNFKSGEVSCSSGYWKEISSFKGCAPKYCGRLVTDIVISPEESAHLLRVCKKGLAFGGSAGGASILDLHSGALSHGNTFINIYQKLKSLGKNNIFTEEDFKVYTNVRKKIQQSIAFNFGIMPEKLYLTYPTFFSEMTAKPAKTIHDEYWHIHVDKETYPSFHYTSLLYLSDYTVDFTGGRFVFVNNGGNLTIEPKMGRVSAFTSGAENPHFVERVQSGARYALTVSFTCNQNFAIGDPSLEKLQ